MQHTISGTLLGHRVTPPPRAPHTFFRHYLTLCVCVFVCWTKFYRRKPQNLTPPLSSDGGSSTSGQSPTSTHNGSPPPAVKRPPLNTDKYLDGPLIKKQRISHFKKDAVNQDSNVSTRSARAPSDYTMCNNDDNTTILQCRRSHGEAREAVSSSTLRTRVEVEDLPMRSSNYYGYVCSIPTSHQTIYN